MTVDYVLFESKGLNGSYIIQNKPPYYVGKVVCFTDDLTYAEYTNDKSHIATAQVFPYRMHVTFERALGGRVLADYAMSGYLRQTMVNMAEYIKREIILKNQEAFRKFL
jgi:hypothetical protein